MLPADGDYVVELSDSRYQGGGRPVFRLVIGPVPMASEVYPLGGRAGETVGLEFRGGTLAGVKLAAAAMNPLAGTELVVPRISSTMFTPPSSANGVADGGQKLDLESLGPLVASSYPEIREPADPTAPPVRSVAPVVFNGRIDPAGDDDRFVLAVTPGQRLRIKVVAYEVGSALDAVLRVLGNGGAALANADDTTTPLPPVNGQAQSLVIPDPSLELTVPGGTNEITLVLRDLEDRGGVGFAYRIVAEPLLPDFQIVLKESEVSVPRGGTAAVAVTVQRRGYTGAIQTTVVDPPAGLSVHPGTIAPSTVHRRNLAIGSGRRLVSRCTDQTGRPGDREPAGLLNGSHISRSYLPNKQRSRLARSQNTDSWPRRPWPSPSYLTPPLPYSRSPTA